MHGMVLTRCASADSLSMSLTRIPFEGQSFICLCYSDHNSKHKNLHLALYSKGFVLIYSKAMDGSAKAQGVHKELVFNRSRPTGQETGLLVFGCE